VTTPHDAALYLAQEAGIAVPQEEVEHYTDWGLARRLVALHGQDLRYCGPWKEWLTWTGQRWASDDTLQVAAWCKDTIKGIYADAQVYYAAATEAAANNDKAAQDAAKAKADALYAWAIKSESTARIAAAIDSARSEHVIPVTPDELDVDLWLFNVQNGTIDAHTGELREHRREDLITKLAPVDRDPTAEFALWDDFLAQAIPDPALRHFIQKAAGSCLTGDASDDVLLFLYGPGGAGKGTFIGGLLGMLGDYATTVELDTFTSERNSHGPRPDLAALRGMRMVVIEEVDDRQTGVVAMLKKVSGGTSIATRGLHQKTFNFKAQFKAWLLGNKRPRFPDDDSGLWRRLRILPFTHVFTDPDLTIRTTLSTSAMARSRILNWTQEGCLLLQQEGLAQPPIVQAATGEYRSDLDPLNDWLADNTIALTAAWTSFKNLYTDYKSWAGENGVKGVLGSKTFSQRLGARFVSARPSHSGTRGFSGIGLKTGYQIQADASEPSAIGEVPVIFQVSTFMGEIVQHQIGLTLPEMSAEAYDGLDPSQVLPEVPAALDPWDEGWQDPEEAQS
jgi:putative DNA primase/helicase